ncbi:MAG: DsbA family protein [Hymenobacteraceae bacterium]|nr:DsbA family protein [Hymenobacteraceae bacterium]
MPFASLTRPAGRPELRYFFDPLCGWCYGFSPVLMRLHEELNGEVDFVAHPGGMVVGDRVGPLAEKAAYIQGALPRLEELTGVVFGPEFRRVVAEGTRIQDSVPPSRALTVLARLDGHPGRTVPFAHELLTAAFAHGYDLADPAVLLEIAARYGLSEPAFLTSFTDPDTAAYTQAGFTAASQVGVTGFPTLVLRQGNQGTVIARGWAPYEQVRAIIIKTMG